MIRHTTDSEWILIPQNAHGESCGVMAAKLSADTVALPSKRGILGITLHDCGWSIHDDRPTLDATGQPTHVFQTPAAITTQLWTTSAIRASQRDPYAGLLASVHGLHLVAHALQTPRDRQTVFELNKFQHAQVEFQEGIRHQLGMRSDLPLQHGLAKPGADVTEDELIRDYRTLRALDRISLSALCSEMPFESVNFAAPGVITPGTVSRPVAIRLQRLEPFALSLTPWPFLLPRIDISIPAKRIPRQQFSDQSGFSSIYRSASELRLEFHLSPA